MKGDINAMANEKVLIVMTSGPDTPRRCASPFFFATLARALNYDVAIFFSIDGILLLKTGMADSIFPKAGKKSAGEYLREAIEAGVSLTACTAAMELHDLMAEDLIPEAKLVGGAWLWQRAEDSKTVLTF